MKRLLRYIPSGSVVLASTTLASYLLGLLRDRFFAQTFGASRALDAYNAAFLLPDFLFNVFVASGIAAAFVPIFVDLKKENQEQARHYSDTVLTAAMGFAAIVAVILIIFAGPATSLVAPGFSASDKQAVVSLLRLLALSPILFAVSNALGSMLVAERRFLYYGLSPVVYNLGIIFGAVLLSPRFGIVGVAMGTLFGALLHLAVRAIDVLRSGFHFHLSFDFRLPQFRQTLRLMLPKMLGHPVELATFWGFTVLASHLSEGSIAVINFSRNFQSVPVSLIGIVLATTTFPLLASASAQKDRQAFVRSLKTAGWLIAISSLAAALFMFVLRLPLVGVLLGGKAFTATAVSQTAATLGFFSLSIPTEALSHLLARAFYATKNTAWPVASNLLALAIALGLGYYLLPAYGLAALPLAFFFASLAKVVLLAVLLPGRIKDISQQ